MSDRLAMDGELWARLSAHRVALTFLIKVLEANRVLEKGQISDVLKVFMQDMKFDPGQEQLQLWANDELDGIIIGLGDQPPSWTPTIIPGGKK